MTEHINHIRRRLCMTAAALATTPLAKAATAAALPPFQLNPISNLLPRPGLASFEGATAWINSPPLSDDALRGKVVLVNFCTYTCINWLRSLPWVRAWAGEYREQGLMVIGVHTPEFEFEKDLPKVRQAIKRLQIDYPMAVDSNHAVWNAFGNQYWPALYLADGSGRMLHQHFGEGGYEQTEKMIQQALGTGSRELVSLKPQGIEAQADWDNLKSPENYLGAARTENFASPGGAALNAPRTYAIPQTLRLNQWALAGDWTMGPEATVLNRPRGRLACRFHARDLNMVMASASSEKPLRLRVLLNGQAPGPSHGLDVDEQGMGSITEARLYQLIRQPGGITDRQIEIEFIDPGVQLYALTFG